MKKTNIFYLDSFFLLIFLALVFVIGALGSLATHQSLDPWYLNLKKASWNPPPWVFAPVWTVLYVMIAISGWLIFISKRSILRSKALIFYFLQLFSNGLWSFLFFYFKSPILGLTDILVLLCLVALLFKRAWPISKGAALLLIPYILWSLYAATLNGAIVYYLYN